MTFYEWYEAWKSPTAFDRDEEVAEAGWEAGRKDFQGQLLKYLRLVETDLQGGHGLSLLPPWEDKQRLIQQIISMVKKGLFV